MQRSRLPTTQMTRSPAHQPQYPLEADMDATRLSRTYWNRRTFTISLVCLARRRLIKWSSDERTCPGVGHVIQSTPLLLALSIPALNPSLSIFFYITVNFLTIPKQHAHFKRFPSHITFSPTPPQSGPTICTLPQMSFLVTPPGPLWAPRRR